MKVSGVGAASPASRTSKASKASAKGGTEFAQHLSDAIGGVGEAGVFESPAPVSGVDALLVVQAATDTGDEDARRKARKRLYERGESILNHLDELRHGLLTGQLPKDRLIELAQLVRGKRDQVDDPLLAQLLDEIELRAEVELAKLSLRA
ncbi:MAG: flagellar assembly protein FliX [Alphaproteobacteria bacterium]|nr:flagellar assembly protein FliX [Alphaproteobacteria bacterium]